MNLKKIDKNLLIFKLYVMVFILSTIYMLICIYLKTEHSIIEKIILDLIWLISLYKTLFAIDEVF